MSPLAWVLIGAGVTLAALAVCKWREAGRTLDAIRAEARREDLE